MATEDKKYRFVKAPNYTGDDISKSIEIEATVRYRNVSGVANQIRLANYFMTVKNNNDYSLRIRDIDFMISNGTENHAVAITLSDDYDMADRIIAAGKMSIYNKSLSDQIITFNSGGITNLNGKKSSATFIYGELSATINFDASIVQSSGSEV